MSIVSVDLLTDTHLSGILRFRYHVYEQTLCKQKLQILKLHIRITHYIILQLHYSTLRLKIATQTTIIINNGNAW